MENTCKYSYAEVIERAPKHRYTNVYTCRLQRNAVAAAGIGPATLTVAACLYRRQATIEYGLRCNWPFMEALSVSREIVTSKEEIVFYNISFAPHSKIA